MHSLGTALNIGPSGIRANVSPLGSIDHVNLGKKIGQILLLLQTNMNSKIWISIDCPNVNM